MTGTGHGCKFNEQLDFFRLLSQLHKLLNVKISNTINRVERNFTRYHDHMHHFKGKPVLFICNHFDHFHFFPFTFIFSFIYFFILQAQSLSLFGFFKQLVEFYSSFVFTFILSLMFHFHCDKAYDVEQSNAPIHVLLDKFEF